MRIKTFHHTSTSIQDKSLIWACKNYSYVYQFRNNQIDNGFKNKLFASDHLLDINSIDDLNLVGSKYNCGWISYDVKNQIEDLRSKNPKQFDFEDFGFIKSDLLIEFNSSMITIHSKHTRPERVLREITNTKQKHNPSPFFDFTSKTKKEEYISKINKLRNHIEEGDIYEACYCLEFTSTAPKRTTNPSFLFSQLCKKSPKPFASFVKAKNKYIVGASPERFIKRDHATIASHPIKGTIKRGKNKEEDDILKKHLFLDPKERSENLMIVDLVRNDLARISKPGTVKVDELFGIYTFPHVHQMISTIRAELNEQITFKEILKATFPMGSMTGAPKVKAMEIIDEEENFSRGVYSGTIGYFDDSGFDFNVVIRSLIYDSDKEVIALNVGSAITYDSIPEKEYTECLTKATSVQKIFNN